MKKKIAIIATNNNRYPEGEKTGLWLSELTHFYALLAEANYPMDILSPDGFEIPLEPKSLTWPFLDRETKSFFESEKFLDLLKNSICVSDVKAQDYHAIFFTGGHGTMWDFPNNMELQKLSREIYENGGVVSAVCHGVSALLNITLSSGKRLIEGKELTGFSNVEEYLALVQNKIPYWLEDEILLREGFYKKATLPMRAFSVVDERLVTGQNPYSTKLVAKNIIEILSK